jgi:hypothetical protein
VWGNYDRKLKQQGNLKSNLEYFDVILEEKRADV